MRKSWLSGALLGALTLSSCGDDSEPVAEVNARGNPDGGPRLILPWRPDAMPDGPASVKAARGEYLVTAVLGCSDCHTPLGNFGPDMTKVLAGANCAVDTDPSAIDRGCLNSRNITPHATTGIGMRSDEELKDMITKGKRPDGKNMNPAMPYYEYANLSPEDLDAVVAYLREGVKAVDNMITASQAPHDQPFPLSYPRMPDDRIPPAPAGDASAARGRYLAAVSCMRCHTPADTSASPPPYPVDLTKVFAGGTRFDLTMMGGVRQTIYSMNLTPSANGLAGYTADEIVNVLRSGKERTGATVCAPMAFATPFGIIALFSRLTTQDAQDIAQYVTKLPINDNKIPMVCSVMSGAIAPVPVP